MVTKINQEIVKVLTYQNLRKIGDLNLTTLFNSAAYIIFIFFLRVEK